MKVHEERHIVVDGGGVNRNRLELLPTSGGGRQTMDYIAMDHKSLGRHVADITAEAAEPFYERVHSMYLSTKIRTDIHDVSGIRVVVILFQRMRK